MIKLDNISLICIGSTKIIESIKALTICQQFCKFKEVKYFTDTNTPYTTKIPKIKSIREYDTFIVTQLPKFIDSDYILSIHWDGFIVNPEAWTYDFFNYDYIGAPWPWLDNICGNGGFCLKSKKFLETQKLIFDDQYIAPHQDDLILSKDYRQLFIDNNCIYAPTHIGYQFSTEYGGYNNYNSFGFHDFRVNPQFKHLLN